MVPVARRKVVNSGEGGPQLGCSPYHRTCKSCRPTTTTPSGGPPRKKISHLVSKFFSGPFPPFPPGIPSPLDSPPSRPIAPPPRAGSAVASLASLSLRAALAPWGQQPTPPPPTLGGGARVPPFPPLLLGLPPRWWCQRGFNAGRQASLPRAHGSTGG